MLYFGSVLLFDFGLNGEYVYFCSIYVELLGNECFLHDGSAVRCRNLSDRRTQGSLSRRSTCIYSELLNLVSNFIYRLTLKSIILGSGKIGESGR